MAVALGVGIFFIIFFATDGPSYLVDYQDIVLKFDRSNWLYSPGDQVRIEILGEPNSSLLIKVFSPPGSVVLEKKIDTQNGQIEYSFILSPSGVQGTYTVIVFDESLGELFGLSLSLTSAQPAKMQTQNKMNVIFCKIFIVDTFF